MTSTWLIRKARCSAPGRPDLLLRDGAIAEIGPG